MNKKETLILGVGNPLRRDDGVGPEIIDLLFKGVNTHPLPPSVTIMDGGTDGLGLIEYFKEYKKVILVDAVLMGMPPGTVKVFKPDDALFHIGGDSLSTHGFGIPELIKFAKELDVLPDLTIIGIQAENTDYGKGLSETVECNIDKVINIIASFI